MMLTGTGPGSLGGHSAVAESAADGTSDAGQSRRAQAYAEMIADPKLPRAAALGRHRSHPRSMRCCCPAAIVRAACASSSKAKSCNAWSPVFSMTEKPVAAICHGVLLAARSISKRTGRSVLWGYQTTALTWAFENSAWSVARITRFWDPNYYRTYLEQNGQPKGFMSVQQEVTRALARPEDFRDVPRTDPDYRRKTSGLATRFHGRRDAGLCGPGSQLCFGAMAGRRSYLRQDVSPAC